MNRWLQMFYREVNKRSGLFAIVNGRRSECWVMIGSDLKAYGRFSNKYAHRVSWTLNNGPIPAGMLICHHCDNPPCVRPLHLFLGSNQDNMDDMYAKGRGLKAMGDRNGSRTHPERLRPASGSRHGSRTHPEKFIGNRKRVRNK